MRRCLAGAVVLGGLAALAACSGGSFLSDREPWRKEAEARCIGSGAVREGPGVVRVSPINGPGTCGADFPLRVSTLGVPGALSFGNDLRPPGAIPNGPRNTAPRWPVNDGAAPVETRPLPPPANPEVYDYRRPYGAAKTPAPAGEPVDLTTYDLPPQRPTARGGRAEPMPSEPPRARDPRRLAPLGSSRPLPSVATTGTVAVTPNATLACPMVSALDEWIASAVQPAAMRWFGQPVAEIRQISAYSCRGMNGNPRARISEHAFGNALDIASFTLVDGRRVTIKNGWHGAPEEQGFLRDVQGAACERFTTVLAPGSNMFHYDHMHVDLMRRANGYRACNPSAVSGEAVAARARGQFARQGRDVTGSVAPGRSGTGKRSPVDMARDKVGHQLPLAIPGEDGED